MIAPACISPASKELMSTTEEREARVNKATSCDRFSSMSKCLHKDEQRDGKNAGKPTLGHFVFYPRCCDVTRARRQWYVYSPAKLASLRLSITGIHVVWQRMHKQQEIWG